MSRRCRGRRRPGASPWRVRGGATIAGGSATRSPGECGSRRSSARGSLIPNKSPGRLTFVDVTLERGATQDRDLFDWFQDAAITSSGLGLTDVNYKRKLDIVQQDRDGTTLRRWSLSRARPVKFVAGDRDNGSDENVIESVTLTYDFFEPVQ